MISINIGVFSNDIYIKLPSCGGALHITLSLVNDKY